MKSRIFNIMQYELHPITKEPLLNEDQIKIGLAHKTITRSAYIKHNKDVYTEADEAKDPDHKAGTPKEDHWHIVIETKNNSTEVHTIAKWFGIPENFIDCPKGHNQFLDCVQYLTHEDEKQQALGKHRYNDNEVIANFDFREALNKMAERKLKYHKVLNDKEAMFHDVLIDGKTLIQCVEENPLVYAENESKLKRLRLDYIQRQNPPQTRINYYISGRGGLGKGLCSRALARSLFPDIKQDDELYFEVGANGSTFEGYDGQPVIIWNDCRAIDLLTILNGRGNVFNVLDTHPTKARQNVKYSSVNLINTVNIINSVDDYLTFLNGLAGEYKTKNGELMKAEDKGQSYRRVPFIINLHEDDFDLLINKGFVEHNANFQEYEEYLNIVGNFQKVRTALKNNEEMAKQIESKILELPKQKYDEVLADENSDIEITEDVLKQFENYGKQKKDLIPTYDLFD